MKKDAPGVNTLQGHDDHPKYFVKVKGRLVGRPIDADAVLAAGREHDRYLRTVRPRDHLMRFFEDGSVFLMNTNSPKVRRLYSLAEIQERSWDFRRSPHRTLWQHIFWLWG